MSAVFHFSSDAEECQCKPALVKVFERPPVACTKGCRVLSSSKRALSAPLSQYVYSVEDKAFSNHTGYTWTPSYLKYCQPTISEQFAATDNGTSNTSDKTDTSDRQNAIEWCNFWTAEFARVEPIIYPPCERELKVEKHRTSYSKFMVSPYLRKHRRPSRTFNVKKAGHTTKIKVLTTQH